MISVSELSYVDKRTDYFIQLIESTSIRKIGKLSKSESLLYLAVLQILIKQKSNLAPNSLWFRFKLIILISLHTGKSLSWDRDKSFLMIMIILVACVVNIWVGSSIAAVSLYLIFYSLSTRVVQDIIDMLEIQKDVVLDKYINLSVGRQSMDLLLAGELAVELVNEYSDELVYFIAYSQPDSIATLNHAYNEYCSFVEANHLKILFEASGRYYEIGGILTLIHASLQTIVSDVTEYSIDEVEIIASAKEAITFLQESNQEFAEIKKFVHSWIHNSVYDLDYLDSLTLKQIMAIILLSKDELYILNEEYRFYDSV